MKTPIGSFLARLPSCSLALAGFLLFATTYAVPADDRKGDAPEPLDRARLQGAWRLTSSIMGGQPLDPIQLERQRIFWVIQGNRLTAFSRSHVPPPPGLEQEVNRGLGEIFTTAYTFELDAAKTPATLMLIDANKSRLAAICRIEGDALTVCFDIRRQNPVPKEFESPPKTLVKLWTFVRTTDRP